MKFPTVAFIFAVVALASTSLGEPARSPALSFDVKSVRSGAWSDPAIWEPARVPRNGERVLVSPQTRVAYDVASDDVIRLLQVAGELHFARDRNTTLNVGLLKVQNSENCSENGFRCDLPAITEAGEPSASPAGVTAALEVGTATNQSRRNSPRASASTISKV